ncbi:MAG: GNAT family N-acetyltransferase [Actinomycetota bacterium]
MLTVRRATLDDQEAMVAVYTVAWREGFKHMFSAATFARDDFDADRRAECTDAVLCDDTDTYVAELSGHIVGWGVATRHDATSMAVNDLWINPTNWGCGAAAAIVSRMEDDARSTGTARMVGWVPEDSPRARCFVEKIGWKPTGSIELLAVYDHEANRVFEYQRDLGLFDMTRGMPRPVGVALPPPVA